MNDLDALKKVWIMAYHANDLGGAPSTDEEKEALDKVKIFIEAKYPLIQKEAFSHGLLSRGSTDDVDYVPLGGAGNGA